MQNLPSLPGMPDSKDMTEEEVMDAYLEKIKMEYKDGWTEENWEEEIEKHPIFMTKMPEAGQPLPPAVEALQLLQWEGTDDTPSEKALKYKDEGNFNFKCKKYKFAIISYTEGLKQGIDDDKELSSTLHNNRAAAQYQLGNYRSAFNDACFARKFNSKNLKALYKGAECCYQLKMFEDTGKWCETLLGLNAGDEKAKELREKSEIAKKTYEKEKRKKEAVIRHRTENQTKILTLIKTRKIQISEKDSKFLDLLETPVNPLQRCVQLATEKDRLVWPVALIYPEFGQTEYIEAFDEYNCFEDHLKIMLGECPPWDTSRKYDWQSVQVFYEDQAKHRLLPFDKTLTLLEVLQKEGNWVQLGTPKFFVMVKNSNFCKTFIGKYNEITV